MIRFAGIIKGKLHHPYIYVIVKNYCLYIGETQKHPVSRWGQHLMPVGTFLQRLKEVDEDIWLRDEEIIFFCVDCEQITTLSIEEHKLITRYVEHKVHEKCILNLPMLKPIEKIISDTTRTAPARCRYLWVDDLASKVFDEIIMQLKRLA